MKTIHIEPFCGVAGDMTVAALLDLGVDFEEFRKSLETLPVEEDWNISVEKVMRHALSALHFNVDVILRNPAGSDKGHKHHHHRTLPEIERIINGASALSANVKKNACRVFRKLAEAEAGVHGSEITAVHFHEVGAVDAIIDITGVCLALEMLGIERITSAPVALGTGSVKSAHGTLPVPVPATVNLLEGIPVTYTGIASELATPTGSALLAVLVDEWGTPPDGRVIKTAYGAGTRNLKERAAVLRITQIDTESGGSSAVDEVVSVIECNVDDMPGEAFSTLAQHAIFKGALDLCFIPVYMKKNRPGTIIQLVCPVSETAECADFLLRHTTTLGVRIREEKRIVLEREIITVETSFGKIRVKFAGGKDGGPVKMKPEYEDVAKIAEKEKLPFLEVLRKVTAECADCR